MASSFSYVQNSDMKTAKRNLIKFQKTLDKPRNMVYDIYVNFKKDVY